MERDFYEEGNLMAHCCCILWLVFLSMPGEIPLDEIWAWKMPGTIDVRTLESKPKLVRSIRRTLKPDQQAGPGFAVKGTGRTALEQAYAVTVQEKPIQDSFSEDDEISIFFFSYSSGVYVRLTKVERHKNEIDVYYQFVPHTSRNMTDHFALIPLGKLSSGTFNVNVAESPLDTVLADQYRVEKLRPDLGRRIVCKSFSFHVSGEINE